MLMDKMFNKNEDKSWKTFPKSQDMQIRIDEYYG